MNNIYINILLIILNINYNMETIRSINVYELHKTTLDNVTVIKSQLHDNYVKLFDLNNYCYSGYVNELNEPHGDGTMIYFKHDKITSYNGEFVNGIKNGNGTEYYKNGEYFTGTFVDGCKSGNGTMYLKSGAQKFVGTWENDKLIGSVTGYVLNNDKIVYYGELLDDVYNGYGIEYNNDHIVRLGYYKDGNAIKWLSFDNNSLTVKEIKIVDDIDKNSKKEIEAKFIINEINNKKNITLDDIKLLEKYMVDNNSDYINVMINDSYYQYTGTVKFDNYKPKLITGKYCSNYGEKFIFEGTFNNYSTNELLLIQGSITKHKFSTVQYYMLNGVYDHLNIYNRDMNITYILKHTIKGMYYNLYHRYTSNEIFGSTRLIFDGDFESGKPKKGKVYKLLDNDVKELVYNGHFKADNNVSLENLISLHGEGIKYANNKKIYEGDFVSGHYHGSGTEYDVNECPIYVGDFKLGLRHGKGDICTLMNDGSYEIKSVKFIEGLEVNK